ncbi:odorant receptor 33b-like [Stomoxys calcitrans]|uniref:odorant receptor 33b-like n=1 Tax=Stomoxys calcitrans TaxID=35570 RepID=UPI0027E2812D|nr:odorant receptor 33b-like [Stomoxys calcitrans]
MPLNSEYMQFHRNRTRKRGTGVNCFCYDALLNIAVTFWYPVHLTLGLLMLPTHGDIFKNLSMTITCIVCTLKHISLRLKLKKLHEIETLLDHLDKRVESQEEWDYFTEGPQKTVKNVTKMYFGIYMGANVAGILTVILDSERRLMYPAWFPFDWKSSFSIYCLTLLYQIFGVTMQIIQNMVNDAFTPVVLCLLGGHVRLLAMRVRKIGYDPGRDNNHNLDDLKRCIEDHIKLRHLFKTLEDALSIVQLSLFISSGLNICVALVYLLFYADTFVATLYYSMFLLAICIELFPIYFYGSVMQMEFEDLTYAIFSSNWAEQPKLYRKNMQIFLQNTLPRVKMVGCGIVSIQLETFFLICRMAYTSFTLIRTINMDVQ